MTQLGLGAATLAINLLVLAMMPQLFTRWTYAFGFVVLVVITVATLALPWWRLPGWAVTVVPFADAVAIGVLASASGGDPQRGLSLLWVFPVMWIAMFASWRTLFLMLATVSAAIVVDSLAHPGASNALRFLIILLALVFIGLTVHIALSNTRALRKVLDRQSGRLTKSLERREGQERRIREIVNEVDIGIARIAVGEGIISANDTYLRLYGLDPADLSQPARSIDYSTLRGEPIPLDRRPLARALRGRSFQDAVVWLFTADGEWRALSVSASRLDRDEGVESMLLVAQDITGITIAQQERERALAFASHEMKSPLTVVLGNAELALEGDELSDRTRRRLETIHDAGERLLEMARRVLAQARTGDAASAEFGVVDLQPILRDSIASFRMAANPRAVTIDDRNSEPLPVLGNAFRLRQVVDNLLSNAVKYTPDGGSVSVSTAIEGDAVALTIADTGIGIAAEDLPRLFDAYFRASGAAEMAGGTGLGLVITHQIVAEHRGTLSFQSEPGVGTTATVRLPRGERDEEGGPRA
ncbi:PAS domain-containing sensor histidine kinase [Microbacterium sp. BWT-B31]|uniref:ATP-binding protein n=1 Tax=Microbacterium sp. BWT-B31 TaxID=3232072 RepID=UPI0035295D6A